MYAIIKAGSKQYRVQEGDIIDVDLLNEEAGSKVGFQEVLLVSDGASVKVGSPVIAGHVVHAEVLEETKGPKVISYRYKRRKNYHRKRGHRQKYSRVKITQIQ